MNEEENSRRDGNGETKNGKGKKEKKREIKLFNGNLNLQHVVGEGVKSLPHVLQNLRADSNDAKMRKDCGTLRLKDTANNCF